MSWAKTLVLGGVAAFLIANLIHNDGLLDPAPLPGIVFAGLMWWRPRRAFLLAAAFFVALPALVFLNWAALSDVSRARPFFNHLFLLLAGVFAVAGAAGSFVSARK
jgi:hypothetical protein